MGNLLVKRLSHARNNRGGLENCTRMNRWAKHTAHWALNSLSTCKVIFYSRLWFLSNSMWKVVKLGWFCWWKDFFFFWTKYIKSKWFITDFYIMRRVWKFSNNSHRFDLFIRRSLELLIIIVNLLRFEVLIDDFSRFRFQ